MPRLESTHHPLSYVLVHAAWGTLGFVCTIVGIALSATLWLLPIGLPLALLGVAIMEAAGESH